MVIFLGVVGFVVTVLVMVGMVLITPLGTISVGGRDGGGSELSLDQHDQAVPRPRRDLS